MAEKHINVQIANRNYPLTVSDDEEEGILLAAQMINENISKLKGSYVVTDYVDLLAMTALELASNSGELKNVKESATGKLLDKELDQINRKIDQVLNRE